MSVAAGGGLGGSASSKSIRPDPLHVTLVETSAKSFLEQLRLIMADNPHQVKAVQRIEHDISQFFVVDDEGDSEEVGGPGHDLSVGGSTEWRWLVRVAMV